MEVLEYFLESTEIRVLHVGRSQDWVTKILTYSHVSQCGNVVFGLWKRRMCKGM